MPAIFHGLSFAPTLSSKVMRAPAPPVGKSLEETKWCGKNGNPLRFRTPTLTWKGNTSSRLCHLGSSTWEFGRVANSLLQMLSQHSISFIFMLSCPFIHAVIHGYRYLPHFVYLRMFFPIFPYLSAHLKLYLRISTPKAANYGPPPFGLPSFPSCHGGVLWLTPAV